MRRRGFLAGGLGLTVVLGSGCTLPVIPKRPAPTAGDALGWIHHAAGRYTLHLPRVEMGQQVSTALKQIACEELGIDWSALQVQAMATTRIAPVRATVGSESVRDYALPLAQACATLREALASGRQTGVLQAEPRPMSALRAFGATTRYVGARVPLEQGEAIVRGQPLYAADMRAAGGGARLYGRVLHAPASPELASRLVGLDEAAARADPGFVALVREPLLAQGNAEGLGLVARTPAALDRIEAALALRWQVDGGFEQPDVDRAVDVDARLARGALAHRVHDDALSTDAPWSLDLRIDIPLAAHGQMEPRAALAAFDADGGLALWCGAQDPFYVRDVLASRLSLAAARVQVQACRIGGAFGARMLCIVELEAALLARAVRAPVLVQWTRAQELRQGLHRPPSSHRIRARVAGGRLVDWWHGFASGHILFTNAAMPPWMQRVSDVIGDQGVARGAALAYRATRRRTEFDLVRLPVYCGPWRGLGAGPNHLAIESAIDECARLAGADALQFRLDHLDEPRLARVLQRAAAAAGWGRANAPAAGKGLRRGRGLACGIYKGGSFAAVVAEVEVDDAGQARATRLVCAHDAGRLVSPDQVRAQCEGNLVWGLGMVFSDALPLAAGAVAARHFAQAPIPRLDQVPPMEIVLVDDGAQPSAGAGETAIVAAAAALANALRDATGVRPTRFPVTAQALRHAAVG